VVGHERVVSCVGFLGIWGGGERHYTGGEEKPASPIYNASKGRR
jgi:hypothetical protein